jgi:cytochrome b
LKKLVLVWDPYVRIAHWSLVILFIYLNFVENQFPGHDIAGYIVFLIIIWRWIWGFAGTTYARFRSFWFSPSEITSYSLAAIKRKEAPEYTSHNPMGALMVYSILITLPFAVVSGVVLMGVQQYEGPLAGVIPLDWEDFVEMFHFGFVYVMQGLVVIHIFGTLWASWWHRENYVLSMITGKKVRDKRRKRRTSESDRIDISVS